MTFSIYFNTKEIGGKLVEAIVVYDGLEEQPTIYREKDLIEGATFYENEIDAFVEVLKIIEIEEYEDVVLYNQNHLIFDWITKKSHDNKLRDAYYKGIRERIQGLVNKGIRIGYKVVKGNKNEAKKKLREYSKEYGNGVQDLTQIFKKDDNVVPLRKIDGM